MHRFVYLCVCIHLLAVESLQCNNMYGVRKYITQSHHAGGSTMCTVLDNASSCVWLTWAFITCSVTTDIYLSVCAVLIFLDMI